MKPNKRHEKEPRLKTKNKRARSYGVEHRWRLWCLEVKWGEWSHYRSYRNDEERMKALRALRQRGHYYHIQYREEYDEDPE